MPDLLAGTVVTALDTPPTVSNAQGDSFTTTSITYGVSTSGGTYVTCGVAFVAPTTGRVEISVNARMLNSAANGTLVAAETRTGSTVGSGTVVEAAGDETGVGHYGTTFARQGISHILSGLTPGSSYNVRLLHKVNTASTGTIALREVIVAPAT